MLNTKKTKELILDFRKRKVDHLPIMRNGGCVKIVNGFKFLGIHVSDNLSSTTNVTAAVKRHSSACISCKS